MERNFYYDIFCSWRCNVSKIKQEMLVQLSFYCYRLFTVTSSLWESNTTEKINQNLVSENRKYGGINEITV